MLACCSTRRHRMACRRCQYTSACFVACLHMPCALPLAMAALSTRLAKALAVAVRLSARLHEACLVNAGRAPDSVQSAASAP